LRDEINLCLLVFVRVNLSALSAPGAILTM